MKQDTFGFKFIITLDRLFNVCTGGDLQECFSTRTYIQAMENEDEHVQARWIKVMQIIDYVFWEDHCKDSFEWEMQLKDRWEKAHQALKTKGEQHEER